VVDRNNPTGLLSIENSNSAYLNDRKITGNIFV